MFERSVQGQQNRAIFFEVDRIVYVEGGSTGPSGIVESFDALFWREIFAVYRPELKVKFMAKGSAEELRTLADQVITNTTGNVVVAMDRDYNSLFGLLKSHDKVLYTLGYSFENDIFCSEVLPRLFRAICPLCEELDVTDEIGPLLESFVRDVWWAHLADAYGVQLGVKVIDRKKPQKYLSGGAYGAKPRVNKTALFRDVQEANNRRGNQDVRRVNFTVSMLPRLSVGHLYEPFVFKLLAYLQKRHSNSQKLTYDGLRSAAIQSLKSHLVASTNSEEARYYSAMLSSC